MEAIDNLRKEIDKIDEQILDMLAERFNVAREIGEIKQKNHLPVADIERFEQLLKSRVSSARRLKLSEDMVENIFKTIHKHSILVQK